MFYEKLAEAKEGKEDKRKPLGEDRSQYTQMRRRSARLGVGLGALIPGALAYDLSARPVIHAASKLVPDNVTLNHTEGAGFRLSSGDMPFRDLEALKDKYSKRINRARLGAGLVAGLIGAGLMKRRGDRQEREYQARRQARREKRQEKRAMFYEKLASASHRRRG